LNLVLCVSIKGAQNSQVLVQLSPVFLWLNRTLCGIKQGSTPYFKKKKIIVQRRRGFSLSLFPFPLAISKENGNIENRILICCVPCTIIPVYTLPAAREKLL